MFAFYFEVEYCSKRSCYFNQIVTSKAISRWDSLVYAVPLVYSLVNI